MRLPSPKLACRTLGSLAACAFLVAAPPAAAGPGARARLRYQRLAGAERCPDQVAFQAEIAAWLGYDPFSDAAPRTVSIDLSGGTSAVVEQDHAGRQLQEPHWLEASLRLEDASGKVLGERKIQTASSDCRDLTQALVLAVALAVDPLPITRDVITPPEPPPPPVVIRIPPAPVSEPTSSAGPTAELSVIAGPLGSLGGPAFAPGVIAGAELRWDRYSLELDGEGDAFTGEPWAPGSVQVSLVAAELVPCYRIAVIGLCAVVAAGAEMGHGQDIGSASSQPLPYIGVGPRVRADVHLTGPLSLRFQVEGLVTALGASFDVGHADAWDTPLLTLQGAAVLALRL